MAGIVLNLVLVGKPLMKILDTKIKRYKILSIDKEHYLVDLDSNKLFWFVPMFVWFSKLNAVTIDQKQVKKLIKKQHNFSDTGRPIAAIFLGGAIYTFFKDFFEAFVSVSDARELILIVVGLVIFVYVLRYISSFIDKIKLGKEDINFDNSGYCFLKQETKNKYYLKSCKNPTIVSYIMFFTLLLVLVLTYNLTITLLLFLFLLLWFFLNTGVIRPYSDMTYVYKEKKY